ncbi:two component transcriptional regulator, LuxR family [Mariprofundus ferrinatatus]|uniref:Two component transcriptional regulator, LuxR family n=1 Tax=Mariprofundus ferrinatatus TaxID=1921087 RepID=A0A2K8L1U6_9PROT|nr:response regulator transcription factor [Mariprofundus ferrinatatus]ATX81257.1 two component transcriptional regulator, LuxR family [Mariprofundus ferrinatatus]
MDAQDKRLPRVLIVEDDEHVRRYFERSIHQHDHLSLFGSVGSFRDAVEKLADSPDVMLVDLGLPDGNGADLIRLLKNSSPQSEAIVITVFADEFRVVEAIKAGATGYLLKDSMPDDIGDLIVRMLAGDAPISSSIARHILKMFNTQPDPVPESVEESLLSKRELEVLQLVARGFNREEIANYMELSIHTVVSHIRHIYQKLEVHSRNEAVFEAVQLGLIKLNE